MPPTKKLNNSEYYSLINHYLEISKEDLIKNPHLIERVNKSREIKQACRKIESGMPLQYITGHAYFCGYKFDVNDSVLIPRPETELLVKEALSFIKNNRVRSIIDIGTGSGCIVISVCKHLGASKTRVFASDISSESLKVAMTNAEKQDCNKIKFIRSDLFENIDYKIKFDLILSNPPYLTDNYLDNCEDKKSLSKEPKLALAAGEDGLKYIKDIIKQCNLHLSENGLMVLEIDPSQGNDVLSICNKEQLHCQLKKDLNQRIRLALIRRSLP